MTGTARAGGADDATTGISTAHTAKKHAPTHRIRKCYVDHTGPVGRGAIRITNTAAHRAKRWAAG
ncbi:hypothetical protein MPRF_02530 [Mycolicibacterium parafortuitum]|uniref:Uncharacterized protein n=1 Tax=Mycolicibacterium parafortuitum TaxID=39692 RepID=A0A7I7TWP4_MYCPF|nr:hypothetical protein MPRF_02530 [Mycolicibacterium parafortuitum]